MKLLHKSSFLRNQIEEKTHVNDHSEVAYATLLGTASRDLREGRPLHAMRIFSSLAKVDFTRQRDARLGEAVAIARMGEFKKAFGESEKMLQGIIQDFPEPTVSKADTLKSLAEVKIGLEHYDGIDEILEEAAQIYFEQGITKANGAIVHLQGLVALSRGELDDAIDKFKWAATLADIKIPEVVPSGFAIEAMPEFTTSVGSGFTGSLIGARS